MYPGFLGVMPGVTAMLHGRLRTAAPGFVMLWYAPKDFGCAIKLCWSACRYFPAGPCQLRLGVYESFDTLCIYLESDALVGDPERNFWVKYRCVCRQAAPLVAHCRLDINGG